MAEAENLRRIINPCLLHLQKMGLELKCPSCLKLLRRPILLPCNHILCRPCVPEIGSSCLVCNVPFLHPDLRSVRQMGNIVSIYSSMEAAFSAHRLNLEPQPGPSGGTDRSGKLRVEQMQNSQSVTLNPEPSSLPYVQGDKQVKTSTSPIKSESETPESPAKYCKLGDGMKSHQCVGQNCVHGAKVDAFVNEVNPAWSPSSTSMDMNCKMGEAHQRDVNQWAQTSPGSPPSFSDMKDSDDDNNDQGSEHLSADCAERSSAKGMGMKEPDDGTKSEAKAVLLSPQVDRSMGKPEVFGKLNVVGNDDPTSPTKEDRASDLKMQQNSDSGLHVLVPPDASKHVNGNPLFVCAFCQSSEESEASGPMLHYANGRELAGDQAAQANALHVHRKCIEWAPQVYFVGETVKNLEAELARGSKIKCSSCGKKGAALGCYSKSCRRSFHVPCAVNIFDCRWDCKDFLMYCPVHCSLKFPSEKKNSGKTRTRHSSEVQLNYPQTSAGSPSMSKQSNQLWEASSDVTSKWVLCGSALSSMEKDLLAEFVNLTGASVTKFWKPNVTHVIASTNGMGACSRTLKFLMGILNGRWIVKVDWIKACMEAKHPVDEEPHEITLDVHGCCNGPKNGRIRVLEKAPKLFGGLNFYFSGSFVPSYEGYLRDLVLAAGGNVLAKIDVIYHESKRDTEVTHSATLLIYNADAPQECESVEESSLIEQVHEAEDLAAKIGSQVAPHTWLLESIAACKLQHLAS